MRSKTVSNITDRGDDAIREIYTRLCQSDNIKGLAASALKKWMMDNDNMLTEKEVDDFIKETDKDGDGIIDYDEFTSAWDKVH